MPGILPMKMIRVGTSNQSRIAQACDRCRSKKIRCDGVRPCCSQCANVGFECKTSDKLSRRAFPRGYTESLEDRVRQLEGEVRELKDLLDEKDEKIDMLSRLHSFSPIRKNSASLSPANSARSKCDGLSNQEEILHVEIPAPVHPAKSSSSGSSTTSALIDSFERKVQEAGRQISAIASSELLAPPPTQSRASGHASNTSVAPPRLLSDQYINLFFQEWQPLLPVLHRQTFLRLYEQFLSEPDARSLQGNKIAIAQLFLIFEIAAHSCSSKARPNTTAYELQWRKALSATSSTASLPLLQCHLLAQVAYLLKADYPHLLRHRANAVSICHQLGLHQGHKYFAITPFESESRKKVFWCQYTIDKYASAVTGMPVLLRESDVSTEYPADIDDENISEQGISPALPGELTKVSSALALFRMSRILSKTLEHLYPAGASYSISLKKLHSLSDELDQWHEELPDHLRLRFCNDKPATHLISDRSPLLSLAYFHTRSLIHRPLLCHGSGSAASAATIVLAAAAKHTAQIIDLLDERRMNYSFPINKQDLLTGSCFAILWQCVDLEDDSKIIKDNQKSLQLLLGKISKENSIASAGLQKIVASFIGLGSPRAIQPKTLPGEQPAALFNTMPAPSAAKGKSTKKQLQAIASRFSSLSAKDKESDPAKRKVMTSSKVVNDLSQLQLGTQQPRANSTISLTSTQSAPLASASASPGRASLPQRPSVPSGSVVNLDYFQISGLPNVASSHTSSSTMLPPKTQSAPPVLDDWEQLVPGYDANFGSPYNTVEPTALNKCVSNPETNDWTNDVWNLTALSDKANVPQSILSFSEESLTSCDDFAFSTVGSHHGSLSTHDGLEFPIPEEFKGITMPATNLEDELDFPTSIEG